MAKILVRRIVSEIVEVPEEVLEDLKVHPNSEETHIKWDNACKYVAEMLNTDYAYPSQEGHPDGILEVWDENHTDMYAAG